MKLSLILTFGWVPYGNSEYVAHEWRKISHFGKKDQIFNCFQSAHLFMSGLPSNMSTMVEYPVASIREGVVQWKKNVE